MMMKMTIIIMVMVMMVDVDYIVNRQKVKEAKPGIDYEINNDNTVLSIEVTIFGESAGGWSVSQQVVRIKSFHFFNPRKKILAQKICTISNNHFQRCSFSRSCSSLQSIDYR